MKLPFQEMFGRGASPFVRWCLSPFLLLAPTVFFIPLLDALEAGNQVAVIVGSLAILLCLSGLLALWGIPLAGRIASGIISLAFGGYLIDQCVVGFKADQGYGKGWLEPNQIRSILGFLGFGLPCLIYTVFGRFTFRKEPGCEGQADRNRD